MLKRKTFPESLPCRYETYNDLYQRLDGTICRYGGKVVYVRVKTDMDDGTKPKVELYDYPSTDKHLKSISPDDPEFDISLLDLGYANILYDGKNYVTYLSRSTRKTFKQGTTISGILVRDIAGKSHNYLGSGNLVSQGFVDAVNGEYPESVAALEAGLTDEIALSPELAVSIDDLGCRTYYWRTTKVAIQVPGQKLHRVDSEFSWVVDKVLGLYV